MTWKVPSSLGRAVAKVAVAGAFIAVPAALAGPAFADPPAPPPAPAPAPSHGEYYNTNDANDWANWYNMGADGGGGGGGGGGG
jgi:hypothetical protein